MHSCVIYELSAELWCLAGLAEVALFDLLVDNQLHQQPIPNEANLNSTRNRFVLPYSLYIMNYKQRFHYF